MLKRFIYAGLFAVVCIGLVLVFLLNRFDKITPLEILEAVPEDAILFAEDIDFELKGVKLVLYVFWNEDGTMQHVTYYLKPNSLNLDTAELSAFISSFMNRYRLPIDAEAKFTHYGIAQFPTTLWSGG